MENKQSDKARKAVFINGPHELVYITECGNRRYLTYGYTTGDCQIWLADPSETKPK